MDASYRAMYVKGQVSFCWGDEVFLRVHTGSRPDDIEIDWPEATICLPGRRRLLVDLIEGDVIEEEQEQRQRAPGRPGASPGG